MLAVVGSIAKKQLQAAGRRTEPSAAPRRRAGMRAAAAIPAPCPARSQPTDGLTVPQQARSMQEQARANTARALEQGVQRNQRADP